MEHSCVTALLYFAHIHGFRLHKDKKAVAMHQHRAFWGFLLWIRVLVTVQLHDSCHKTTDAELAY